MAHAVSSHSGSSMAGRAAIRTVDCDIHPNFVAPWPDELAEYFPPEWRARFRPREYKGKDAKDRSGVGYTLPSNGFYPLPGNPLRSDLSGPGGTPPASDAVYSATELLDAHEIDRAILIPQMALNLGALPNGDVATVIAGAINRWTASRWLSVDRRWRATIIAPTQDPIWCAAEINRLGKENGFVGVYIALGNVLLGHKQFHPIYEAAQEYGLAITLHVSGSAGIFTSAPWTPGGAAAHHMDFRASFPYPYAANLANLVASGTFERFPRLKVVFTEVGFAWLPDLIWRMDAFWKSAREDTPWVKKPPSEYIFEHCRFTTQPFIEPHRREQIPQMLDMICAERTLLFSTDYPHWDSDDRKQIAADIPERLRRRVMFENALETYGERLT